jgi:serine/threonine-protein kinase SRPK3
MIYGNYMVNTLLGQGYCSNVYLATCVKTNIDFAIKIWKKHYFSSYIECELLELLKETDPTHPGYNHIVHLHDSMMDPSQEDSLCLIFPVYEGTLLDLLTIYPGGIPEDMIRELTIQICKGLSYIHKCGIIHADIKLENILYKRDGDSYHYAICDFGNAMYEKKTLKIIIQTRQYRCIESILQTFIYTTLSDMTSVGCVIAEMATGVYLINVDNKGDNCIDDEQVYALTRMIGAEGFKGMEIDETLQPYTKDLPPCSIPTLFGEKWVDLIIKFIHPIPKYRISAHDALEHPWLQK